MNNLSSSKIYFILHLCVYVCARLYVYKVQKRESDPLELESQAAVGAGY